MNKNFKQTTGQIAPKSYPSCVVKATNIAMEANKLDINLTCPKDRLLNVASPVQNELVIGLEDNLP